MKIRFFMIILIIMIAILAGCSNTAFRTGT
jgi:predicted small secreted protein